MLGTTLAGHIQKKSCRFYGMYFTHNLQLNVEFNQPKAKNLNPHIVANRDKYPQT